MRQSLVGRGVGYVDLARQARKMRSKDETVRANAQKHLSMRLGKLRGLPQKIGQILSMSRDEDLAEATQNLTDGAEPLPFREVEPILRETWELPVEDVVASIDPHGLAASLGQVHRAELPDGREVAVKVQYPGIRKAVKADLRMLGWLSSPVGDLRRGFDMNAYRSEILRDLEEELDYRVEAKHQQRFQQILAGLPEWIVPQVIDEYCGEKVLVTSWVEGEQIEDATRWPANDRFELATTLLRGFLHMLFREGLIHGDPHPGNYRFRRAAEGPQVILYDYGSVTSLSPDHRLALLKLIEITMRRKGDPFKPLAALGFDERLLLPIRDKLAAVCSVLFDPFRAPGQYDLSQWKRAERMEDILGADRWNFRMSAPAHLIFIMRAFAGLCYYLDKLGANVAWSIALQPHLDEARHLLDDFDVSAPPTQAGTFDSIARHLKICVTEKGQQKVALTFPCAAIDDIANLMGDELCARVQAQGQEIDAIVRRVRAQAYVPQDLFEFQETDSSNGVRVWLE